MTHSPPTNTSGSEDRGGHTKGPWRACGTIYEHMNCEVRSGAKGEGQGLAQVWDGPNAFRDGQLMAAAPELLEALIASQGIEPLRMELEDCLDEERPALVAELQQIEAQVEAAIAKATGS